MFHVVILVGVLNAENIDRKPSFSKNRFWDDKLSVSFHKNDESQREHCEVTCAMWEEIFKDIDDALKQLKDTDDDIKADLTRNVFQNETPRLQCNHCTYLLELNFMLS